MTIDIHKWKQYLNPKVDKDLYVFGAQGQNIVTLLPDICQMAGSLDKVDKILTLFQKRLKKGYSVDEIDAFDCSGLFMKFAIDEGLFKYDMNADGIYNSIPDSVSLKNLQEGDFVFYGSVKEDAKTHKRKWSADHIGYVIDNLYVIEARGSAYGVVKTLISERPWEEAKRPYWWSGITPKPEVPVLSRELYYTSPMMRGDDVKMVQKRLADLKYDCGDIDGVFGEKTKKAVISFQSNNKLTADGIVGAQTASKLGFKWEG